jgi:hypothetical protein
VLLRIVVSLVLVVVSWLLAFGLFLWHALHLDLDLDVTAFAFFLAVSVVAAAISFAFHKLLALLHSCLGHGDGDCLLATPRQWCFLWAFWIAARMECSSFIFTHHF